MFNYYFLADIIKFVGNAKLAEIKKILELLRLSSNTWSTESENCSISNYKNSEDQIIKSNFNRRVILIIIELTSEWELMSRYKNVICE